MGDGVGGNGDIVPSVVTCLRSSTNQILLIVILVPHHRSCGDCLEGKGGNYQVCSVQYCVQQLCTVRCTHI